MLINHFNSWSNICEPTRWGLKGTFLATVGLLHPSLTGLYFTGWLLGLPFKFKTRKNWLTITNTPAYYTGVSVVIKALQL